MIRPLMVVAASLTLLGTTGAVAGAQQDAGVCDYRLSAPYVVDVSGTAMVTATLEPGACDQATVFSTVACVQLEGAAGPGQCRSNNGNLPARVYYGAYQPGATYVSTGRGCATVGNPPQPVCQPTGPITATL
ncbi:hypothetical protein [Mycolicibacterium elephantis]|uniref:Secreted protein n=1 Tax=Mycolicibacterium elephantis DSM 44368 TaxID=1335622 RepID=A0A439DXH7_9MYCO|nr:hypothetical protein [Mycolicibacterium elephantis]MCV7222351.1 hypothetical protein [Mycolicibacterium elephantis]RWA22105.1 hypothetical protein MELE44368_13770 [Mycolicibacterium elephantis DSM 44368]